MRRSALAWTLLGIGFAGLVDGALFHQILQWHHFVVTGDPRTELLSDGLFTLAMLIVLALGARLAWRAEERSARVAWGGLLLGAGILNLADIVVDHALLGLHVLMPGDGALAAELAWGALSLALVVAGLGLLRPAREGARVRAIRPS